MAFWRRSKGRHALGAAVTAIPAAPRPVAAPPPPVQPPAAVPVAAPSPAPAFVHAPLPPPITSPPAAPPVPTGPRVELTFRDGSSASLDATQARALDEIAQVLTRRDEVKH